MRLGLSLVSLLVVVGILMLLFKTVEAPQIEVGQKAHDVGEQITGHDINGTPAYKSYSAQPVLRGNEFAGIKITELTTDGPMQAGYGLQVGDVVLQIGGNDVQTFGDYDSAKGQLDQAYQSNASLQVLRDGNKLTLLVNGGKSPLDVLNGKVTSP